MKRAKAIAVVLALFAAQSAAEADEMVARLPAGASPMTSAEVKDLYSGKTLTHQIMRQGEVRLESRTYYGPDGRITGYDQNNILPTHSDYTDGSWTVTGNKICLATLTHQWPSGNVASTDCRSLFKAGKQVWIGTFVRTDTSPDRSVWAYGTFESSGSSLANGNSAQQGFLDIRKAMANGFKD